MVTQPNQGAAATRVPSAGDTANPDQLKDDLEKYEDLEELAKLFLAAKLRHLRHHSRELRRDEGRIGVADFGIASPRVSVIPFGINILDGVYRRVLAK